MFGFELNFYTYPGYFCLVIWVLFFFVILLLFKDDKPIQISAPHLDTIITKPNLARLETISEASKEDSTNLVNKEIKELLEDENKAFSYSSVSFMILIAALLVSRVNYTK